MSRTHHHGGYKPWVKRPFGHNWFGSTPGWWTAMLMNRPKRAANHRLEHGLLTQKLDPEATPYPLGSRKPHNYYW